jgi:hypothetical protein
MKAYRVKNWDERYETHETRKLKTLRWVPMPNQHDGLAYKRIAMQPDATDIFTAWILILQIVSKSDYGKRGLLERDGIPLTPEDCGIISGYAGRIFERAIPFLASIGWLEAYADSPDMPGESPDEAGKSPAEWKGMEGKEGKEGNGRKDINQPTISDCIQAAEAIGMKREDVEAFHAHYDSQGWKKGNGQPITNIRSALTAWKNRSRDFVSKSKQADDERAAIFAGAR